MSSKEEMDDIMNKVDNIFVNIYENKTIVVWLEDALRYALTELYKEFPTLEEVKVVEDGKHITTTNVFLEFSNKNTMNIGDTYMVVYDSKTLKPKNTYSREEDGFDSYASSILCLMRIEAQEMIMKNMPMIKSANKN
jgi:hypothetical protein